MKNFGVFERSEFPKFTEEDSENRPEGKDYRRAAFFGYFLGRARK